MKKRKIIDYMILASNNRCHLSRIIKEWSGLGYELWGNPFMNDEGKGQGQEICQTMIKSINCPDKVL